MKTDFLRFKVSNASREAFLSSQKLLELLINFRYARVQIYISTPSVNGDSSTVVMAGVRSIGSDTLVLHAGLSMHSHEESTM